MAEIHRDLIFDLDGTLIDSAPDIARALNRLLAELGRPPLDIAAVRRLVGDGAPDLVRKALAISGANVEPSAVSPLFERYRGFYLETATHSTRPYPGVVETLTGLRDTGHRLAVCTNKLQTPTLQILGALDLAKFFDAVVGGDQAPARKPDPRHLMTAVTLLGGSAESSVMIGDGINDAGAAKAAAIPLLVLDSGYGEVAAQDLGADLILGSFSEIPAALERLRH